MVADILFVGGMERGSLAWRVTYALGARVCTHGSGVQVLTDWLQQAQAAKAEHQVEVAGVCDVSVVSSV